MTGGSVPHNATWMCAGIHCEIHQVDEPNPGYRGCGECFHLFRSARELRMAHRKVHRELYESLKPRPWFSNEWVTGRLRYWWGMLSVRAGKIWTCPLCTHDF